jgi:DNA (cytosine-5)-methyltransferase 1
VAYSAQLQRDGSGEHWEQGQRQVPQSGKRSGAEFVAHAHKPGPQGHGRLRQRSDQWSFGTQRWSEPGKWLPEPDVGRVAHGVPRRVDRLKALGNAVVPQVVQMIGHAILEAEAMR